MHSHRLSVPFPASLLCRFQPVGHQKRGEAAHGILPLRCPQNTQPGWTTSLLVPCLGDTCHVRAFLLPITHGCQGPVPAPGVLCTHHSGRWMRTVVSKGFGNQWGCPRSSTGAEVGGRGWWARWVPGGGSWVCMGTPHPLITTATLREISAYSSREVMNKLKLIMNIGSAAQTEELLLSVTKTWCSELRFTKMWVCVSRW